MTGLSFAPSVPKWVGFLLFLFAVALQAQITLGESEYALGIRLSSSDFLLPFSGLVIAGLIFTKRSSLPVWAMPHTHLWMIALTIVVAASFVWGFIYTGELSTWALYNRFMGWFVLLAYFYAGGWFVTHYGAAFIHPFLKIFSGFCFLSGLVCVVILMLRDFGYRIDVPFIPQGQVCGFLVNRNAYAFSFIAAFTCICFLSLKGRFIFSPFITRLMIALTPFILVYNGSRALWGIFLALMIFFAIYNYKETVKIILLPLVIGAIMVFGFSQITGTTIFRENQIARMDQTIEAVALTKVSKDMHLSEGYRAFVTRDALHFWHQSPITGVGLGSYLFLQKRTHGILIDMIDNTPLWVLTEMGILGFGIFCAFGLRVTAFLIKSIKLDPTEWNHFMWVMLVLLAAFSVMSLVHQLLYARFLWFFMGLALARPAIMQSR